MKYIAIAIIVILTAFGLYAVFTGRSEVATVLAPTNAPTPSLTTNPQLQSQDMNPETLGVKQYKSAPEPFLEKGKEYIVTLKTNMGDIDIKLFQDEVPVAANNFAFLAKDGFYDGLLFHRVVNGFMIQGGDPLGTGAGGPGYQFDDESVTRSYDRGIVAYANSGPNTNGSQFFIMHKDYQLPPQYIIFGEVTKGMDTVDRIADTQVELNGFGSEVSKPVDEVRIEKALLSE